MRKALKPRPISLNECLNGNKPEHEAYILGKIGTWKDKDLRVLFFTSRFKTVRKAAFEEIERRKTKPSEAQKNKPT